MAKTLTNTNSIKNLLKNVNILEAEGEYMKITELLLEDDLKKLNSDELWHKRSVAFYELDDFEESIRSANFSIGIFPNSDVYYLLGCAYFYNQNLVEAEMSLKMAITFDKHDVFAYWELGSLYMEKKQYSEAVRYLRLLVKGLPDSAHTHYKLAEALFENQEYIEAKEEFLKFLAGESRKKDYYVSIAKSKLIEIDRIILSQSYKEVREIIDNIKKILLFTDPCLTHYTSLEVTKLLILSDNNKLRLSEGAFLNDPSEGVTLFNLFSSFLKINPTISPIEVSSKVFIQKPFIGSYVAKLKENDLTLWRMFGKDNKEEAKGCAITMARDKILLAIKETLLKLSPLPEILPEPGTKESKLSGPDINDEFKEDFNFYRVAYKVHNKVEFLVPGMNKKELEQLHLSISELISKVDEFNLKKENAEKDILEMKELLNDIAYLFKSEEYVFENEVRLVVKGTGFDKKVDLTSTPPRVYVELAKINPLITQLTLGPKVERADEWSAAFHYHLANEGYSPEIHVSHLPFK